MQNILFYIPILYVYQNFEMYSPNVFSTQTMKQKIKSILLFLPDTFRSLVFRGRLHTFAVAVQEF